MIPYAYDVFCQHVNDIFAECEVCWMSVVLKWTDIKFNRRDFNLNISYHLQNMLFFPNIIIW